MEIGNIRLQKLKEMSAIEHFKDVTFLMVHSINGELGVGAQVS